MKQCVENAESEELIPILVFKKNYKDPHIMIRLCDIDVDGYNIKHEIKAQKMNVWNLIDENIEDMNDVIIIERSEVKYVTMTFSDWADGISDV